jgi:hypothetical protein
MTVVPGSASARSASTGKACCAPKPAWKTEGRYFVGPSSNVAWSAVAPVHPARKSGSPNLEAFRSRKSRWPRSPSMNSRLSSRIVSCP